MPDPFERLSNLSNSNSEVSTAGNAGDPEGQYPKAEYWYKSSITKEDHKLNISGDPTIDIVNSWSPSQFGDNKKDRIFTSLIRNYKIVQHKGKDALKIQIHGVSCGVDGATGCYSILSVSEKGFKIEKKPTSN